MGFNVYETQMTMKCAICKHGETTTGTTTVTLERGGVTLVVRNVPAEICDVCGERYFSEETSAELRQVLEAAETSGGELHVRSYAA